MSAFDLDEYRARRNRRLELENEHLRAERLRLERLLGRALQVAVAKTGVPEAALLEVIAELEGTDLARPAYLEHRERMQRQARVVQVLRETT